MKVIKDKVKLEELKQMSEKMFDSLVKAVVDVEQGIMVVDADLHADQESLLIENDSKQENLWGINIYPHKQDDSWIEFDSIINLRPVQNNKSRSVEDKNIQNKIIKIVNNLVEK